MGSLWDWQKSQGPLRWRHSWIQVFLARFTCNEFECGWRRGLRPDIAWMKFCLMMLGNLIVRTRLRVVQEVSAVGVLTSHCRCWWRKVLCLGWYPGDCHRPSNLCKHLNYWCTRTFHVIRLSGKFLALFILCNVLLTLFHNRAISFSDFITLGYEILSIVP